VKIGFKFQSMGKLSNISAADPPPSSFRSIPTLIAVRIATLGWLALSKLADTTV